MYSVWVEVDNSDLAEGTCFRTLEEVKVWVSLQLDMYSSIEETVRFEIKKVE